jgi:hypothetical protein
MKHFHGTGISTFCMFHAVSMLCCQKGRQQRAPLLTLMLFLTVCFACRDTVHTIFYLAFNQFLCTKIYWVKCQMERNQKIDFSFCWGEVMHEYLHFRHPLLLIAYPNFQMNPQFCTFISLHAKIFITIQLQCLGGLSC